MNIMLIGKSIKTVADPTSIILTDDSDSPDGLLHYSTDIARRHNDGFIASYIDSHVMYLPKGTEVNLSPPAPY